MAEVRLTVHRATRQIGGNCIEISASDGSRLILDAGRPLDALEDAEGLVPATLDLAAPCQGVLISHPHQDHYGLIGALPATWPIYSGEAAAGLIRLTFEVAGKSFDRTIGHWKSGQPMTLGPFRITPYLTDHSAFDAYMLLIEVADRRILYTGDFRTHGRKGKLVRWLMDNPPPALDVLLIEGTNLGSDKPARTEDSLENDFVSLFKRTRGRVFVCWSSQNIDRTVTLYRACRRTERTLVVDLYCAHVLRTLAAHGHIPQPEWESIKVVITSAFAAMYRAKGNAGFVNEMARHGIAARRLAEEPSQWVTMVRPSLIRDYEWSGVVPTPDDAWSWSMWSGYLKEGDGARIQGWFEASGTPATHIHSSGHASPADLRAFAASMRAKAIVPIHGLAWDTDTGGFPPLTRLSDGEPLWLA
ncbi:MBL fold metallo-hydrolase [Cupriavidus basilensis]|uniref:MBL fold metallo-hydrolase n=1 Tax=Cupriavidus basilensis TaxID=68895 RepID=UPI0023E7A28C|nr:MBL fold metallo-hydrolase [Cupriavidus basilensis]MDF3885844.1 MBL fold metallo-hydrolase [Cupriavidus basilensis]